MLTFSMKIYFFLVTKPPGSICLSSLSYRSEAENSRALKAAAENEVINVIILKAN